MTANLYRRRPTRAVFVGQVGIGGHHPIRVQSMTTSDTRDTESLVREIGELSRAGCEIVRVTVPTQADCDNLPNVRREMAARGIRVPLVADIHFTPSIALKAVDYVEKVRINPGNFADKKLFKTFEITDADYRAELARIEDKFSPLVLKCKERGVAMRIGTNHGSLSDRIMNRFGDTPEGMVESALEFLRIAAKLGYHDIVLSMKAANPQVMVTAYRLLVGRMDAESFDYPLHLGVTEAGDGEDARVKSAVGIGTLLEEGIGDTVRVSLTEDSIHEIPVAGALAAPYTRKFYAGLYRGENASSLPGHLAFLRDSRTVTPSAARRPSRALRAGPLEWGGSGVIRVWTHFPEGGWRDIDAAQNGETRFEGVEFSAGDFSHEHADAAKGRSLATAVVSSDPNELLKARQADKIVLTSASRRDFAGLETLLETKKGTLPCLEIRFDARGGIVRETGFPDALSRIAQSLERHGQNNVCFGVISREPLTDYRILAHALDGAGLEYPIHLLCRVNDNPPQLDASTQLGGLLIDGIGDAVQIDGAIDMDKKLSLSYGILQAARARISKTEFIACPSCGRTQFNLQEVTARIKARTSHLKGLKIAVMGCIVNGPGEMADADFGYVGTGSGRISLYVGKDCVERNIDESLALERLVGLIKEHGRWRD